MGTNITLTSPTQTVSVVDPVGFANGNTESSKLGGFNIYQGKVKEVDYVTKRLVVSVNTNTVYNCIYVASTVASLLGVSSTLLPSPGTNVVCLYTPMQTFVIGIQPQHQSNPNAFPNIAASIDQSITPGNLFPVKLLDSDNGKSAAQPGYPTSSDVLPGEEEMSNNMAITLRFLSSILQLDASGLSLIEQCMLNDMVRIVDQYFVHHNCGGDTLIWNNGTCNYEDHFTSYPLEAAGKLKADDPIGEKASSASGVYKMNKDDDPYDSTGRWRKSTYIGFLGDMVHYWITNPTAVISTYAEGAARAGQFRTWVGSDGTLMVLAAGDILIEATSFMPIPEILHKWDNPEFNKEDVLADLNNEYLKIWGKEPKTYWDDMNASIWLMRQYLRYITIWHSLSRFRLMQDKGYCKIPVEKDSAVGNKWSDEEDKKKVIGEVASGGINRSIFRCSPDGSVAVIASPAKNGISSVVLNQGNILLSAANNVEIKACGTVSITGQHVAIKANKILELVSIGGNIVLRAKTAWKALCEAGRVWLKGDMPEGGEADSGITMPQEFKEYSVIIDSSQGKTLVHGAAGSTLGSTNPDAKVTVEALNGGTANIYGMTINMDADKEILSHTILHGVFATFMGVQTELLNISNVIKLNSGATLDIAPLVRLKSLYAHDLIYSRHGYIGPMQYVGVYEKPFEHDGPETLLKKDSSTEIKEKASKLKREDVLDNYPETEFSGSLWSLGEWLVASEITAPDSLKLDYWADAVRVNKEYEDIMDVTYVNMSDTTTAPAVRTDSSTAPWPGANSCVFVYEKKTAGFAQVMEEDFKAEDISSTADMKPKPMFYMFNNWN